MTNEEKRWEWEVVEEGVSGGQITVEITPESVESYADAVRNRNSRYYGANNGDIAMPTNIFSDAKLRRHSVAEAAGFTALEKCINNPRQTPFAKCTARWFEAIKVGDKITSFASVLEKYDKRGNQFVTFRVHITNQNDTKVAEFDYTCIFKYAAGQKLS